MKKRKNNKNQFSIFLDILTKTIKQFNWTKKLNTKANPGNIFKL